MEKYGFHRDLPVDDGYDLVVAGGGPAGCAAAVCAARLGARVLLVEGLGCLGGAGTSGLVVEWGPFGRKGTKLVGGFIRELYEELLNRGFTIPRERKPNLASCACSVTVDAEGMKLVLDELMIREKVEVRFFTQVVDADSDLDALFVKGVILSNIEGLRYVKAKAFIDCTGDATLANMCGVPCCVPFDPMPPTLMAILNGMDWKHTALDDAGLIIGQQKVVEQAIEDGFFSQPDRHVPGLFEYIGDLGSLNAGHVFKMDALNCRSLSDGMMEGRRQVQEYTRFFREYFPEFRNAQLVTTATLMGVRDSRRIKGEYWLSEEDYRMKRTFPDQIAINAQGIDLHVRDCSPEEYERFSSKWFGEDIYGPGEFFGIPYGVLVPKGARNLWVAGRSISCDSQVHASIRMQLCCAMFGQAAGVAAVQSIRTGQAACALDTDALVRALRKQGAILPQETLSEHMSRSEK